VHVVVVIDDMSQFVRSTVKVASSLSLTDSVYPVIGEPPLSGADQVIMTSSGLHVVRGADGCVGTYAVRIDTMDE
jgi:hypothetical protein